MGDRVMGLVGGGAHAEAVVVHQDEAMAVPPNLDFVQAAAIPEAFLTAWDALVTRGRTQHGERVLIHAVGSGVGTAALQLVRQLGAVSVGTSRSAAKLEQARSLGLDEAISTAEGDGPGFASRLSAPVNVILDVLGGPALAENLEALAPRGRLVLLGFLQGPKADVSLEPILRKRLEVIGSVMRTRLLAERIPLVREFSERVLPWFGGSAARRPGDPAPTLRPVVGAVYAFVEIAKAHADMERDTNFGKLVLTWA
jgi:NADPH:quinone reductase-like Zn-dependent oxidoreductase